MTDTERTTMAKVPAVTLVFWIIKILATTLGETAGDTVSMSMNLGYLVGTAIFVAILILLVWRQVSADRYRPFLYWATIIASTTAGTTLADFATRSLGIGYPGGSLILLGGVAASLWLWHHRLGSVAVATVHEPRAELFYWITITFSQTLGTALGDWTADTGGLGYGGAAVVFGAMLAAIAALYLWTAADRVLLFWSAFILTRPLGAAVGDLLDKPLDKGGFAFSRPHASAVLVVVIALLVVIWPLFPAGRSQRANYDATS
ncbi:COG4705 family protein [Sphingomonas sp. Tas61C01]|uniref:COG4705 family protein n=1 Tax=Sphingomonas sp. Tas61C01 TaxID=3458297 RepID=UPI00403E7330